MVFGQKQWHPRIRFVRTKARWVKRDFELLCWDLVSVPSTPGAYMKLSEGKQIQINADYSKVNSLITEIICNVTGACPLC